MDPTSSAGLEELATTNPGAFLSELFVGHDLHDFMDWGRMTKELKGFSVQIVESVGGDEGEGEHVRRVLKISKDGFETFIATHGYYESYNGITWDDTYTTVYPRQVVVTQYFTTKE